VVVHGQVQKATQLSTLSNSQKKAKEEAINRIQQDDLKVKKAWEIAIAPAKTYSLPETFGI
jgi:hypothetical protein